MKFSVSGFEFVDDKPGMSFGSRSDYPQAWQTWTCCGTDGRKKQFQNREQCEERRSCSGVTLVVVTTVDFLKKSRGERFRPGKGF